MFVFLYRTVGVCVYTHTHLSYNSCLTSRVEVAFNYFVGIIEHVFKNYLDLNHATLG